MYCKRCKQFFQPTLDEEKLIVSGALEEICTPCATKEWVESVKNEALPAPMYPGMEYKGDGTQLYRADWFEPDGTHRAFIAMPPLPLRPALSPLRPSKTEDLRVSIMSGQGSSERGMNEPTLTITTNLERFREWDPPVLWVQKLPDFYDDFTGIGRIEVPAGDVIELKRTDRRIDIKLADGSSIRLLYR